MTVEADGGVTIRRAASREIRDRAHELADVLMDAVEGGAALSMVRPLPPLAAVRWALDLADATTRSTHVLLAEREGLLVGLVQLVRMRGLNQPHRADVRQLMVHRSARRHGTGRALMRELEVSARVLGISLLTVDTVAEGAAAALYEDLGYVRAGLIPGFLIGADGKPVDAALYYKALT